MQARERSDRKGAVRVAAVQCAAGADVDANLATCLRMLDEAATRAPDLVVLPEFMNHLSWYESADHCRAVSVTLDGPFLAAIAARARVHRMHVVVNCTVRRDDGAVTGTSVLFSPDGARLATSDKQVLMGHENDFLARAREPSPVTETPIGRIGLYACMDGVVCETPRSLALRGAQILCNSLNSFAPDEASLHVPVRAAENRAFVVAANKVGPLIPEALLDPVSEATKIPRRFLHGAGESQIVAPDGTVLAKGPRDGEAIVVAEIDPRAANDKRRPDGTDVFASRRRDLYRPIAAQPATAVHEGAAAEMRVAVYAPRADGAEAIDEAARAIERAARDGAAIVCLPELFCFDRGRVVDAELGERRGDAAIAAITRALAGTSAHVATTLPRAGRDGRTRHTGVLVGAAGIAFEQPQLHACARHAAWAARPSDEALATFDLPGARVAIVVGDDAIYPETMRLAAMRGVGIALVPFDALEAWETRTGLVERSAENRVCLVACTRPSPIGAGLITTLHEDFTLMTPWKTRPFDGCITAPIVARAGAADPLLAAAVHPRRAWNKVVSHRTHLLDDRPWALAGALA